MEHYSAINKNEIILFAGKWLSKISQIQKDKNTACFLSYVKLDLKNKQRHINIRGGLLADPAGGGRRK
jgi:hypothetical protein